MLRDEKQPGSRRAGLVIFLLYLGMSLSLVQLHSFMVNFGGKQERRLARHEQIMELQGQSPWCYRLAVPFAAQGTAFLPSLLGSSEENALEYSYLFWRWLFTLGALLLFHRYVSTWLDTPWALTAGMFFAGLHSPSYAYYWFQPASSADLLLWLSAAVLTISGKPAWLYPLLLLGGLNRETSVFIIGIHAALQYGKEPTSLLVKRSALLLVSWALAIGAGRTLVHSRGWAHGSTVAGMLSANLEHPGWLLYAFSFFGLFWLAPFLRWSEYPAPLRRMAVALSPYLVLQFLFGRIREVRLLLPISMVVLPMGMLYVRSKLSSPGLADSNPDRE